MKAFFAEKASFVKYCIAVLIAALLAIFYAYSTAFPYRYEQGGTWNYPDLLAEAPLAITDAGAKGDSVIRQVENRFVPVFKMDKDVVATRRELLKTDFQRQLRLASKDNAFPDVSKSPQLYLQFAERLLTKIYEQGILPEHEKLKGRTALQILKGDQLKTMSISDLYTLKSARQAIADSLPGSKLRESEFLLSLLEDKIIANLSYDEENSEKSRSSTFQQFIQRKDTLKKGTVLAERGAYIDDEVFYRIETYRNYIESNRSVRDVLSRFLLCFLLNLVFLSLIDIQIAAFQPELMRNNGFMVFLAILVFGLQGVHLYVHRYESILLLSPVLLYAVLLRKSTIPFLNAGIFVLMVLMASQSVVLHYSYTVAFIGGGLFFLFCDDYFSTIKAGLYLRGLATAAITVLLYILVALMHDETLHFAHLALTFAVQSAIIFLATKYISYVKQ